MKKRGVKTPKERQNSAIEDDPSRVAGPNVQDKSTVQNIDDYQCCGSLDVDFPEVCALLGMTEVPAVTQRKKTAGSQNTEQSTMESSQSNVPNGEETTPWCPKPRLQVELENEEDPRSAREVRVLGWKVDERVTRAFNKTLPCLTNLQRLHMWQVGLTGRTLSSLTNTVSLCCSLRTVALEGTPVPEQCFHLLMAEDSKLVHLSLRNNRIGEEGAQLIGGALSTARGANKSLLSLNMAFNSIGDAGAQHIAKGLRLNRTLLCLSLGFNHIGDDGASYLAEVLGPFSLSHEEIVERRKLLSRKDPQALSSDSSHPPSVPSSSSLERTATKGGKPASKKKPPPKKEEKQAANQAAGAAGKKEDQKNAKKGADAKVPRGRGLKSGGRERSLSVLDTETSGSQSKIAEAAEMVSPLLDTDAQHGQGRILLPGNNVLTSLNLSGNRLTERSLSLFLKAVKEQDDGGLLRLSLSRNRFPLLNCETYQKIQEVMKCKDPLSKNIPVKEEQGRSAESQNLTDSGELAATYSPTCLSLKTCCTRPPRRRRGDTRRSVSCRAQTPTSWTSSVQDATRSPRCSATRRQWCCVWAAPLCCANPPEGRPALQKGAHSGGSSTSCSSATPVGREGRGGVGPRGLQESPHPGRRKDQPACVRTTPCIALPALWASGQALTGLSHRRSPLNLQPGLSHNKTCTFFLSL